MYNKVECVVLSCDNCGDDFQEGSTDFSLWMLESDALEHAKNDGWIEHEGKHYCSECHTTDEEDNLVINAERTKPINA